MDRLNLEKLQPPKVEEKKKSAASSVSKSKTQSKTQSKQNISKNHTTATASQSQPAPSSPDIEHVNGTQTTPVLVRNKSTGNLTNRKRKAKAIDEVKFIIFQMHV